MKNRLAAHLRGNAVAWVALCVALGGTSYAAVALPKNSVGTKQLKKSAVTSAKVRDRSLLARDFRAGQLPRGATGLQGPAGAAGAAGEQGVPGEKGTTGDTGPRGPSNAYVTATPTANVGAGVEDSIAVPAGDYVVVARGTVENSGAAGAGSITCEIKKSDGTPMDTITVAIPADAGSAVGDEAHFTLVGAPTLSADGSIDLDCSESAGVNGDMTVSKLAAVRVAELELDIVF